MRPGFQRRYLFSFHSPSGDADAYLDQQQLMVCWPDMTTFLPWSAMFAPDLGPTSDFVELRHGLIEWLTRRR